MRKQNKRKLSKKQMKKISGAGTAVEYALLLGRKNPKKEHGTTKRSRDK